MSTMNTDDNDDAQPRNIKSSRPQHHQLCMGGNSLEVPSSSLSLYPSREDIESIEIPTCDEVFAKEDERVQRTLSSQIKKPESFQDRSFRSCFLRDSSLSSASSPEVSRNEYTDSRFCNPGKLGAGDDPTAVSTVSMSSRSRSRCSSPPPSQPITSSYAVYKASSKNDSNNNDHRKGIAKKGKQLTVEICPGVFLPVHGAEETLRAAKAGRMVQGECFVCEIHLFCIAVAEFILCPQCRTVSPIWSEQGDEKLRSGVGLGMFEKDFMEALGTK